jgi:hypothetical protein
LRSIHRWVFCRHRRRIAFGLGKCSGSFRIVDVLDDSFTANTLCLNAQALTISPLDLVYCAEAPDHSDIDVGDVVAGNGSDPSVVSLLSSHSFCTSDNGSSSSPFATTTSASVATTSGCSAFGAATSSTSSSSSLSS